jgi:hypothetical protein
MFTDNVRLNTLKLTPPVTSSATSFFKSIYNDLIAVERRPLVLALVVRQPPAASEDDESRRSNPQPVTTLGIHWKRAPHRETPFVVRVLMLSLLVGGAADPTVQAFEDAGC